MEEKELKEKELRLIADKLFEEYLNSDEADCLNIKTDNKYSEEDNLRIKKLIYERLDYLEYREEPSFERGVFLCNESIPEKRNRPRRRPVQAYISNISVPNTLDEMLNHFIGGNSAQTLIEDIRSGGKTNWTVPGWVKRGDIVFFMHAKTANSTLTTLRTELRINGKNRYTDEEIALLENEIASELSFHKQYGGKIYAIGRINGKPERYDDYDAGYHWNSRLYCDIDRLYLLDKPVHISEFNSFINVSRQSAITPVYNTDYNRLKEIIMQKNDIPEYFRFSYSTPFPSTHINRYNWIYLGMEYRRRFILESQFRSCYVDYLLSMLGDQKKIFKECACFKDGILTGFVDNVIKFDNRWLPVEIKLNIDNEANLNGQCMKYCSLDKLVLNKEGKTADKVVNDKVLVIDTYAVYLYDLNNDNLEYIFDLDKLKMVEDVALIGKIIRTKLFI